MSHHCLRTSVFSGLLGLSLALVPVAARAEDSKDAKKQAPATPKPAGMVVAKDPVTGELRAPTAEEAAELNQQKAKTAPHTSATRKLQTVRGPHGAVGVVLDDSSAVYAVATKSPDGKVTTKEVNGATLAKKPVQQGKDNEK